MKAPLVRRRDVLRDRFRERFRRRDVLRHPNQPAANRGLRTREAASARRGEGHRAGLILAEVTYAAASSRSFLLTCVFVHYLDGFVKRGEKFFSELYTKVTPAMLKP